MKNGINAIKAYYFYLGSYWDFFFFNNNIHNAIYMLLVNAPKTELISETN